MPSAETPNVSPWLRRFSTSSAPVSSAFEGMQPQLRQTPPGRSSSITATRRPSCAARMAAT
jgi:hypothetical protein